MKFFKSFTEYVLCNLIFETKESLFICPPLLQPKVMGVIDEIERIKTQKKDKAKNRIMEIGKKLKL